MARARKAKAEGSEMSDQASGGLKAYPWPMADDGSGWMFDPKWLREMCEKASDRGGWVVGLEEADDLLAVVRENTRARESELEQRVRLLEAENRSLRVTLIGIRDYGSQNPGHGHTCGKIAGKALRGAENEAPPAAGQEAA